MEWGLGSSAARIEQSTVQSVVYSSSGSVIQAPLPRAKPLSHRRSWPRKYVSRSPNGKVEQFTGRSRHPYQPGTPIMHYKLLTDWKQPGESFLPTLPSIAWLGKPGPLHLCKYSHGTPTSAPKAGSVPSPQQTMRLASLALVPNA